MTTTPPSSSNKTTLLVLGLCVLLVLCPGPLVGGRGQDQVRGDDATSRSIASTWPTREPSGMFVRHGSIRKLYDTGGGVWVVNAGEAAIRIEGSRDPKMHFWISGLLPGPPEHYYLFRARHAANRNDLRKTLNLSDDQVEKLKAINIVDMVVSDEDRRHIRELWDAYQTASQSSTTTAPSAKTAEQNLLDALATLSLKSIDPTLEQHKQAADAIRLILTPEQIAIARKPGFGEPRRAASRPSSRLSRQERN